MLTVINKFFSGLCPSSLTAALALMTVSTQLLLMDKINFHPTILGPSITSTFKGLTRIRPLSCGFDSSVGRALHWHRSSSVTAALGLMTVSNSKFISNINWTEWSTIQGAIVREISKPDEHEADLKLRARLLP